MTLYIFVKTPLHAWLQVPTEEVVGAVGPLSEIGPKWSYLEKDKDAQLFIDYYKLTMDNLQYEIIDSEFIDYAHFQEMHVEVNTIEEYTSEVESI